MPPSAPRQPDLGLDLAMAIVASSHAPVLLLDGTGVVVSASEAFCQAYGVNGSTIAGRAFATLGAGEWAIPQLHSLLKATASGLAEVQNYEFDLKRAENTRRLVVNAHKLNYGIDKEIRLLLTVSDITDARIAAKLNDELLREKGILLQEIQHRVANSLQIIASVLMQSAKRAQSEEARGHLHDAHSRVMSIAAIQKQLAVASVDQVSLQPYLTQLCESIGASMIHDHDLIKLEVNSDDSRVNANVSVSLGLVVTELVINALKHAFPAGRRGKITVDYSSAGTDWTLDISDNGVGMSNQLGEAKPGLGTNIVQALAKQLDAHITVTNRAPGTAIRLAHPQPDSGEGGGAAPAETAI